MPQYIHPYVTHCTCNSTNLGTVGIQSVLNIKLTFVLPIQCNTYFLHSDSTVVDLWSMLQFRPAHVSSGVSAIFVSGALALHLYIIIRSHF